LCKKVKIIYGGDLMLYFRNELIGTYNSTYKLNKAIENGIIYKIENGLYSDEKYVNPLAVISKKYPNFIFTMDSAFYYWNLTDVIPNQYHLATKLTSIRINNKDIKQYFLAESVFKLGKTQTTIENITINIYDREKMLIELLRKKNQIPFDYYKEIVLNYRKISNELDNFKIADYISYYKNEENLYDKLQSEVF